MEEKLAMENRVLGRRGAREHTREEVGIVNGFTGTICKELCGNGEPDLRFDDGSGF